MKNNQLFLLYIFDMGDFCLTRGYFFMQAVAAAVEINDDTL